MATTVRKTAPKPAANRQAGMGENARQIYVLAIGLAGLFGVFKAISLSTGIESYAMVLLWATAFIYGMFLFQGADFGNIVLRFLLFKFGAEYGANLGIGNWGTYVTGWFEGWAGFLAVLALGMALRSFYDRFLKR